MKIATTLRASYPPTTEEIGQTCVDEIRQQMAAENINATGETSASLQVLNDTPQRLTIAAVGEHAPIASLEKGRPPFAEQITEDLIQHLERWVQVKPGFVLRSTPRQAAEAVARKIAAFGTERYINPRADIYTPAVVKAVEAFRRNVGAIIINALTK